MGIKFATRPCVGLTNLRRHKFKHIFKDVLNILCSFDMDVEP